MSKSPFSGFKSISNNVTNRDSSSESDDEEIRELTEGLSKSSINNCEQQNTGRNNSSTIPYAPKIIRRPTTISADTMDEEDNVKAGGKRPITSVSPAQDGTVKKIILTSNDHQQD